MLRLTPKHIKAVDDMVEASIASGDRDTFWVALEMLVKAYRQACKELDAKEKAL